MPDAAEQAPKKRKLDKNGQPVVDSPEQREDGSSAKPARRLG